MNTKKQIEKSLFIFLLIALLLLGIAGCQSLKARKVAAKDAVNPPEADMVEVNNADPSISEEDAIKAALAAHFGMEENAFYHFEVKENTGSHARGGVDNGYFLAAKVDGQWVFVAGGHSAPNCNDVARYGFPTSMVPECESPTASPELSDEDAIRTALAVHFEMDESEFYHFEVNENTGMYAKGGVDNGYFLSAKVDGQWIFVDGGHGAPDCVKVAQYGFPASMVPWCPTGGSNMPDCPGVGTTVATFIEDVNYPDGSILEPGQIFLKTWRIQNVGTCTWNPDYDLVFFGGDAMSGPGFQPLTDVHVAPGETKDISVWLTAPETPGTYRGNWKFRDPNGEIFGLTTGNSIWIEIKVQSDYSDYPTIEILDVTKDGAVTIKGENFPPRDKFNVVMNYYGTLGINGTYVTSINTGDGGKFTDTYSIPAFLEGQSYIAIRLESPFSGFYAYNWFYNS